MGDELDFLPTDKCKSFLQVDIITLAVLNQALFLQYLMENVKYEVDFLLADNH